MLTNAKEKLNKLLDEGAGIQHILDTADKVTGQPLIFFGLKYNLIARSKSDAPADHLWVELITTGRFSHETVDFFKKSNFIEAYFASHISLMQSPGLRNRINGVVFDVNGIQIGNICIIEYTKPLTNEEYEILEIVCEKIAFAILECKINDLYADIPDNNLIELLIEGKRNFNAEQDKQIQKLHKQFKKNIYVAVVDIIRYDHTLTHLVYFTDLFKRIMKDFHYFIYLNNIVILLSSDQKIIDIENSMKELNEFFVKYNIYAGVSGNMETLYDLKQYFKEALNALNYGMSQESDINIFNYDTFRSELYLNTHIDEIDIRSLCHPILFMICDYDKQNHTNYLQSLNMLFICGFNSRLTAKKLKISTKETQVIVRNLKKLFKIDFNNGNIMFAIFQSVKLYKCFPEKFTDI